MIRVSIAALLPLALAACDKAAPESDDPAPGGVTATPASPVEAPPSAAAADQPVAPAPGAFAQCKTCHRTEPNQHGIGPSLAGVYGGKAASRPGYNYSAALKASGLTWDDASLDGYIESPMKTVPGTKMAYPGIKDPARRAEVIAYLKAL